MSEAMMNTMTTSILFAPVMERSHRYAHVQLNPGLADSVLWLRKCATNNPRV
jgi:hypothetical protein